MGFEGICEQCVTSGVGEYDDSSAPSAMNAVFPAAYPVGLHLSALWYASLLFTDERSDCTHKVQHINITQDSKNWDDSRS